LLAKPNVVGVGAGYKVSHGRRTDNLSIVCLVKQKTSDLPPGGEIPREVDGIVTDVVQVGELWAFGLRDRLRPAPGGASIGHYAITAGTLGVVVRDRDTGARMILSNNHVLANSNDATIGDAILQPGPADGGEQANDTIATLERFIPIQYSSEPGSCSTASLYAEVGNFVAALMGASHRMQSVRTDAQAVNMVDCALAKPIRDGDVLNQIDQIGEVSGSVPAALGMPVRKTGRTTGFTQDQITAVDATVTVNYGSSRTAQFDGQLVAGAMSQGGDSGSLVVDGSSQAAVGLLFAGSNATTIFSPIQDVLNALQVDL
jgi:hypothetical protein